MARIIFYGTFLEDVSFIGTPAFLLSPWMTVGAREKFIQYFQPCDVNG